MTELQRATDEFIRVMSDVMSTNEEVNVVLQPCFKVLSTSDEDGVNEFMKRTFSLAALSDPERASLAATICGYLVERGFPSYAVLDDFIGFYEGLLDKARPFYEMLFSQIKKIDVTEDERDEIINELYSDLINDKDLVSNEVYNAIAGLDKFYACGISLFTVDEANFYKAKNRLKDKVDFIGDYSQGCYWFSTLFTVLFNEPVVVIDIDREIGFTAKMNGITDNYQLQHLLMGIPFLNEGKTSIEEDDLAVVNGEGEQTTDHSVESKWNMYNIGLCAKEGWQSLINTGESYGSVEFCDCWIWSEGAPQDIPVCNGRRVILLGLPSYSRSSRVQRTFKNLKANIEMEKELTKEEIKKWLYHTV